LIILTDMRGSFQGLELIPEIAAVSGRLETSRETQTMDRHVPHLRPRRTGKSASPSSVRAWSPPQIHRSWRNRPAGDQPWSDREWNDENFRANSDAFQGAGIDPQHIADATLEAILQNRFYVFRGEGVEAYLESLLTPILEAENSQVITWGPDLRSGSQTSLFTPLAGYSQSASWAT
jgi:hypothetical protein